MDYHNNDFEIIIKLFSELKEVLINFTKEIQNLYSELINEDKPKFNKLKFEVIHNSFVNNIDYICHSKTCDNVYVINYYRNLKCNSINLRYIDLSNSYYKLIYHIPSIGLYFDKKTYKTNIKIFIKNEATCKIDHLKFNISEFDINNYNSIDDLMDYYSDIIQGDINHLIKRINLILKDICLKKRNIAILNKLN